MRVSILITNADFPLLSKLPVLLDGTQVITFEWPPEVWDYAAFTLLMRSSYKEAWFDLCLLSLSVPLSLCPSAHGCQYASPWCNPSERFVRLAAKGGLPMSLILPSLVAGAIKNNLMPFSQ